MRALMLSAFLGAMCCALPGAAEDTKSPKPTETVDVTAQRANQQVCTDEVITGTLLTKHVCRTQGEIDSQRDDARRFLDYGGPAYRATP